MLSRKTRIFIAGHQGMVGAATLRLFVEEGFSELITASKQEVDLTNQAAVSRFFARERPEAVILCAAKVGGIQANIDKPATFLLDNLQIETNVVDASFKSAVKKFVFLGSSCIYPRECPQPMKEEYLLTGKLEPTNEGYALAKIAGIKLLEGMRKEHGFESISLMPSNLYGPNDSFDLRNAHVLSALVKRFVDAKEQSAPSVTLWGSGTARREFMHVDDAARAILFLLDSSYNGEFINVGTGTDISIRELADNIAALTDYTGDILWDRSKPDGMLRKCMDITKITSLGFHPTVSLKTGLEQMIDIYKEREGLS